MKNYFAKVVLVAVLSLSLISTGCSVSQFEAVLNEVAPAISTVIQIVAIFKGTTADTSIATRVAGDVTTLEHLYSGYESADAANKPGFEGDISAAFQVLNSDLGQVYSAAQVSDPNTQAKVSALISLIQTAVGIAEAAVPHPAAKWNIVKHSETKLTAEELVTSWNKVLTAKTGIARVDNFTRGKKLHYHSLPVRVLSLGRVS